MSRSVPTRLILGAALAAAATLLLPGCSIPAKPADPAPTASADAARNFGFPLGFSPSKMDTTADPRQDFRRYAGGRWLDAAKIPADQLEISGYLVMQETVQTQLRDLLQEAARTGGAAPKGSPAQQVGDFYASGMDVERLKSLGVQPLVPEFERIAKVQGPTALAEELARLQLTTGSSVILGAVVAPHPQDRTRMTIYLGDASLGLGVDNYLKPDAQRIRDGYVAMITDYLVIAGWKPEAARATAQMVLAVETRVARKKLTPLERRDPAKRFVPMPYADLKRLMSNVDLDTYFQSTGLPTGGEIVVVEVEALRERNAILAEYSPEQSRAYLQYELLRRMAPYLTPAFDVPDAAFSVVLYGKDVTPPRDKQVAEGTPGLLGHPLSQLYVAKYMTPESRREVEAMVARIKAQFRARIERNGWLSPETRAQALAKLDKTEIRVGYPSKWIDYTGVVVRRDDYVGNAMRLNEFLERRELAKLGKPVELDHFAMPKLTLPIVINAGYDPSWNGIEIPAAFLQPPFYDRQGRPRRQLLHDGGGDRARADARFRFVRAALRRDGQRARLVDASRRAALCRRNRKTGKAGRRVRDPARAAFERRAGSHRKPGRRRRRGAGLRGAAGAPPRAPGCQSDDRRLHAAAALLPRLGAAVGRQGERGGDAAEPADRRPSAGRVPDGRAVAAREGFLRGVRHPRRRPHVARRERPRHDLVRDDMKTMTTRALVAVAVLALAGSVLAADGPAPPRKERVTFAKGASSATIKGTLKGGADVDYLVRAAAGQTLEVKLQGTNSQNYFNVLPPGSANVAMYASNTTGERSWSGVLPADGDYAIRVYLMRPAARRNESSKYTLTVAVTGKPLPPLPAARDAKVAGTAYHATAKVSCTLPYQPDVKSCDAGVVRRGNDGTATFEVDRPHGRAAAHPVRAGQAGRRGHDGSGDGHAAGRRDGGEGERQRALRDSRCVPQRRLNEPRRRDGPRPAGRDGADARCLPPSPRWRWRRAVPRTRPRTAPITIACATSRPGAT